MGIFEWNIQGLNDSCKRRELITLMNKKILEIIEILESKVHVRNQMKVMRLFENNCLRFSNREVWGPNSSDSIWVIWNHGIWNATLVRLLSQLIHGKYSNVGSLTIYLTFVYGRGLVRERVELWNELIDIARTMMNKKWVVLRISTKS